MNNITVAGTIGRDMEVFSSSKGEFGKISVADGSKDHTIWWNVLLSSKTAAAFQESLTKGAFVIVSGNLTEKEYTSKEGVLKRSMTLFANSIQIVDRKEKQKSTAKDTSTDNDEPF